LDDDSLLEVGAISYNSTQRRLRLRRMARWVRDALYRVATLLDGIVHWRKDALLPPAHLRIYYYGTWNPQAFARAAQNARAELISRGLQPEHRVLDIGSGIGNLAVSLIGYLNGGYDGIEIHCEAVAWCQKAITPHYPKFRFHGADLASVAYNPKGVASAATYQFPFTDRSFDFILVGSVFTHMLPDGIEQYVGEISRVLAPGGVCVASFFLLNEETRPAIDAGRSFMSFGFEHPSGLCRLHSLARPEAAVAFDETFVRRVHKEAGLVIRDVRRGKWWSGEAHDQDVLTIVPTG